MRARGCGWVRLGVYLDGGESLGRVGHCILVRIARQVEAQVELPRHAFDAERAMRGGDAHALAETFVRHAVVPVHIEFNGHLAALDRDDRCCQGKLDSMPVGMLSEVTTRTYAMQSVSCSLTP